MTLSNNAIKFLQAQYRAIFKRAYVKGLATAVLLTAGLAAGQAQAAELSTGANAESDIITQGSGDTFNVSTATTVNSITIQNGHSLSTSGGITVTGDMTANGDLTITSGAILLANKETVGENANQTIYRHDFTSNGADLNLSGNIGAASFSVSSGTLVLTAGGDGNTNLTAYGSGWNQDQASGNATDYDRGTANGELLGMTVTVNAGTNVAALNLLTVDDSKITLAGSGSSGSVAAGNTAYLEGSRQIAISDTEITVNGYANGIFSQSGQISDSKITINKYAKLLIAGNADNYTEVISGSAQANVATYSLTNTDITNAGTLQLGTSGSNDFTITGGSMSNTGTVIVNADELSVTDEYFNGLFTKGTDSAQGKLNFSGSAINVDGSVDLNGLGIIGTDGALTTNFTLEDSATLTADTVTLDTLYNTSDLTLNVKTLNVQSATDQTISQNDFGFILKQGTISVSDSINLTRVSSEVDNETPEDRIYVYASGGDATFNMINDGSKAGTVTGVDRFYVGYGNLTSKSTLNIKGNWDLTGVDRINVANSGAVILGGTVTNLGDIRMQANGKVTVEAGANVSVGRLVDDGAGSIEVNGVITFSGDGIDSDSGTSNPIIDFEINQSTLTINNGGTLAITGDAVDNVVNDSGTVIATNWSGSKVTLNAGATLQLNLADNGIKSLDTTKLSALKSALVSTGSKGSFNFGDGFTVELSPEVEDAITNDDGTLDYSALETNGINDVQGVADGATVTVDSGSAASGINLSNGASAVKLASGTTSVAVDGTLMLNSSANSNFVYSEDAAGTKTVADVSVKANSGVNLTGNGTVGSLTKAQSATGTSAVLTAGQGATQTVKGEINLDTVTIGQGTVEVAENVTATTLTLDGTLTNAVDTTVSGNTAKSITATTLTQNGGTLVTNNLTLGASGAASTTSELKGVVNADSITIQQATNTAAGQGNVVNIINDSLVAAETFTAASGSVINVGTDGDGDSGSSSTGTLDVGSLVLNGATLTIDPIYGLNYASTIVNQLSQNNTLDGSVNIGQNSILAVGFEDKSELNSFLAENKLLDRNGSLFAENGSLLIVNDTMTIADGYGVALNGTQTPASTSDAITVDSGAAVVVTPDAFGGRDGNGELAGTYAIKFENDNGNSSAASGSVTFSNGGKVLLAGAFSVDDFASDNLQIFTAETTAGVAGTVTVTGGTNAVQSTNGVLTGSISADGKIQNVTIDDVAFDRNITHASAPVKELLYTAVDGTNVLDKSALGYEFLSYVGTQTNGQDAEAAARLATFGGVVQAGLMAQQTSTDAVAERLGMANPNSALITSSNAQGGGLWLAPVYKNQDSDEFDAQGVDYGADIDLYGLALGADFTTESGVRVGALFNLGSGDADGQGVGSTVSNDFDYFGFTLYAGATFGNFALTADAGFTQLSNDLEQSSYMGTLKADTDTTVTSVGLRGEYLFATPWVDVVPHLGVRYTSLDMDSYDVHSDAGVLASTDADSIQVFSIPFGVTFSKDMAMGNWLVKPVFDLTLTANTGDDEIDSTTTFTGMQSVALSTEIMDSFTYGATLGINAQYQESISFGLNIGYTGSSSADEFGVNANARYTF